jgi:hypothetical protein
VLVNVRVEHIGSDGDETVSVSESDFGVTGSGNVLHDGFSSESSCSFYNGLQGELFPGGSVEGYVCVRVPREEADLILVVSPPSSFGDSDARRFIRLE